MSFEELKNSFEMFHGDTITVCFLSVYFITFSLRRYLHLCSNVLNIMQNLQTFSCCVILWHLAKLIIAWCKNKQV